jgi:mevalonate kinase
MQYNSVNKYPHDNDLDNIFFVKKELFFLYQLSSSMLDLSSCFFETVIIYTKKAFFCINKW